MHRTIRVPRLLWWSFLVTLLFLGSVGQSSAQNGPPNGAPKEVSVSPNASTTITLASKKLIKKVDIETPGIIRAAATDDAKAVRVTGLSPGITRVRLIDIDDNSEVFLVTVPAPPAQRILIPAGSSKTINLEGTKIAKEVVTDNATIAKALITDEGKSVTVMALTPGTVRVIITDKAGIVDGFEVFIPVDVHYLRHVIRCAVPTSNIEPLPTANNGYILSGTVAKPEEISVVKAAAISVVGPGVIDAMRVGGVQQVQLDVVIAQVNRSELREMSVNWFRSGSTLFLGSAITPLSDIAANALVTPPAALGNLSRQGPGNLVLGTLTANSSFWFFLRALRTENLAKFIAEPRLVTMSGKTASFLSGGRLAVPEPSGLGTNAVRFEPFGTQINFLPIVLGNGKIFLEVEPIVDIINQANGTIIGGTAVPGFDSQRLHATVELEDGQTFAIGGLIQNTINNAAEKVPLLGDLPFLGVLFSTKSARAVETELLILVTPHLVDGMACTQLPKYLPGQETRNADDFELFLEGILEAPRGPRDVCPGGIYKAAHRNSPTHGQFPCGLKHPGILGNGGLLSGHGGHGHGCYGGGCDSGCCPATYLGTNAPAVYQGEPAVLPTGNSSPLPATQPGSVPQTRSSAPTPTLGNPQGLPATLPAGRFGEPVSLPAGAVSAPVIPVTEAGTQPAMPTSAVLGSVGSGDSQ